jgi:hypothetical protein
MGRRTARAAQQRFISTGSARVDGTDRNPTPNGSLMRLAPVPMVFWRSRDVMEHVVTSSAYSAAPGAA